MANQEHVELLKRGAEVWNQWREDNPDITPDFRWANLSKANISQANLSKANLLKADLSWAEVIETNLSEANLHEADFSDADILSADLSKTNLSWTDFSFANVSQTILTESELHRTNLSYTRLHRTIVDGANFDQACLYETQFSFIDLSTAINLDLIKHLGPSTLGIETLVLSKGKIPELFLRGCGVPEDFITYIPLLLNKPIEFYSCFISYAHADKAFARQLHDFLQGRGIRCWLDEHQLLPGHDIFEEIDRGIKLWDKVLLCASKDSLTSWWVDNEIDRAFKKEQTIMKSRGKKVLALIPLDLDGFIFDDWENGKAPQVKSRLTADFTGWQTDNDKLQKQFELVLKALRTDGGREAPPSSLL